MLIEAPIQKKTYKDFSSSLGDLVKRGSAAVQTWKMSETLPEQDCSFPDFTRKCANYVNFEIATKQRNLSANTMFTTFTSLHHIYLITTTTTTK